MGARAHSLGALYAAESADRRIAPRCVADPGRARPRRRGVLADNHDRGFVISDHADWPALLDTITATGAGRVIATHGHADSLARFLREHGLESSVMRTAWENEGGADDSE